VNVSIHYQIRGKSSNQIASGIEDAIRDGRIAAGARLPAIRSLASSLRVSPATVAAAYHSLRVRGLLRGSGRRGTIVNRRPPLAVPAMPPLPAGVRNLMDGNPDPALLPPLREFFKHVEYAPPLYGTAVNRPELLEAARRWFDADGVNSAAIAVVNGAMDAIERVLEAHLGPGDSVAVEDPCYRGTLDLVSAMGLVAEPVAIDEFGPIPEAMESALRAGVSALIVTPRGQNPTGAAMDRKRASALSAILGRHRDVLVVEDDFTGPISGAPLFSLSAKRERWAVVRSFSKFLGPDLRVALVAGDPLTIARVEGRQHLGPRWVSHVLQAAAAAMLSDAGVKKLIGRAAETYAARRNAMLEALRKRGVEARGRSGLNIWVPVAEETGTVQSLLKSGYAVLAGESFRLRSAPGIRVMIASLDVREAPRVADAIAAALRPRGATHVV
jgi:DNA-binding transcriptional MocR family regulator